MLDLSLAGPCMNEIHPCVLWFTGLSGSGKSTLAVAVHKRLKELGYKTSLLDGDAIRDILPAIGFSEEERNKHVRTVGFLASELEKNGIIAIVSLISPYRSSRDFVRKLCRNFIEVFVSTPIEECEERDVKGLYKKARQGEISNFTGIDDPYEVPERPELNINTQKQSVNDCVQQIFTYLNQAKSRG